MTRPELIRLARRTHEAGHAVSTAEQIIGALINGRADWLPNHTLIRKAIELLHEDGFDWWHMMLCAAPSDWDAEDTAE